MFLEGTSATLGPAGGLTDLPHSSGTSSSNLLELTSAFGLVALEVRGPGGPEPLEDGGPDDGGPVCIRASRLSRPPKITADSNCLEASPRATGNPL